MRVIPFPDGSAGPDESWLAELDAALSATGEEPRAEARRALDARMGEDPGADSWRELREDVRALAPPMNPEFERELSERIAERGAPSVSKRSHRRWGRLRPTVPAFAAVSIACMVIAVVLIAAPWRPTGHTVENSPKPSSTSARVDRLGPASGPAEGAPVAGANAAKATNAPAASGAAAAPGRVQQLGASIALATTPEEVQTVADRVSRLAVSEGGFVQSSHVNEGEKTGEANLTLSLPSAKLSAALAALGRIAPVRAESQSLQDITNTYDQARLRLSDAVAERQALLRALAKASTAGEIDSLRARLAQAGGAIARARTAFGAVSKQASNAEVEVTIVGDKNAGSEGLTLQGGLHDAGRVLTVTLVVLLIAAAVLLPLALVAIALATGIPAWRRHRRERVLGGG